MTFGIEKELARADLGDARRTERAMRVVGQWACAPSASFPEMSKTDAELQALYGFVENEAVEYTELLAAHALETLGRIDELASGRTVLVVHDTSSFTFGGESEREGLGWVGSNQQGFFGHFALALLADGSRRPLGVLGLSIHQRERPVRGPSKKPRDGKTSARDPNRESLRWGALVDEASNRLRGHAIPINVMDREADIFDLLARMVMQEQRFVVRARELDRPVTSTSDTTATWTKLRGVAERAVPLVGREAHLHRRPKSPLPSANKKHPPRSERLARLEFAAESVRFRKPSHLDAKLPKEIELNFVHVREIEPPADAQPVEWLLLTTEPIETATDVLSVVDCYRARWTIEEFFKAIKTGCAYEERQLESAHALFIALALCVPIAWQMLVLRHQARVDPDAPAATVMSSRRLEVLRTIAKKQPLPPHPTVLDVLFAVAGLGGHIARNGPPGWQTLRKGLDKLLFAEEVLDAHDAEAEHPPKCDE